VNAITTRYTTNRTTGAGRVVAKANRFRLSIEWDHALNSEENHNAAAKALAVKQGWVSCPLVNGGTVPNGDTVHVFSPELKEAVSIMQETRRAIGLTQAGERNGYVFGKLSTCGDKMDAYFAGIGHKCKGGEALQTAIDRLTAWAEHHETRARTLPDSEVTADRNSAANYRDLIKLLRTA
jgi:hypothetical protein